MNDWSVHFLPEFGTSLMKNESARPPRKCFVRLSCRSGLAVVDEWRDGFICRPSPMYGSKTDSKERVARALQVRSRMTTRSRQDRLS